MRVLSRGHLHFKIGRLTIFQNPFGWGMKHLQKPVQLPERDPSTPWKSDRDTKIKLAHQKMLVSGCSCHATSFGTLSLDVSLVFVCKSWNFKERSLDLFPIFRSPVQIIVWSPEINSMQCKKKPSETLIRVAIFFQLKVHLKCTLMHLLVKVRQLLKEFLNDSR